MSAHTFIALAGNPNAGKTTAFNWYTGSRQHVGNYPGITVEKKEGTALVDGKAVSLVDLPGTYSLTAYSLEEVVSRRVLAEDKPGAILNVINAGVLERNLYLTVQMLEMGLPVVIALNMMDEARARGIAVNVDRLEELMGVKAVSTVARTGEGLGEALRACLALAEACGNEKQRRPLEISYGSDIDAALKAMVPLVETAGLLTDKYPARWVCLKFLERDEDILKQAAAASAATAAALQDIAGKVEAHLKTTLNAYPEGIIADYRYGYISSILRQGVLTEAEEMKGRIAYSDKMDTILTHRFFGFAILLCVLYVMYWTTFTLGDYPAIWLGDGIERLSNLVSEHMREGFLKSLVISGVIGGVGGILGFVPLIMIMFLFIAFLEDSGYMARVAYMMDRIFRFFGLHGASVMPFIISGGLGGGCAVPGVMATRTLRSPKERLATMLTAPFMSCGAKIPVFLLLVGVFFSERQELVMFLITITGWAAALLVARLLRSTLIRGEATPFVMELPPYRWPTLSGILIHTWERTWQYIKKAGTIILAIAILMWAAMAFPELPDAETIRFDAQAAPIQERLEALPSSRLDARIVELAAAAEEKPEGAEAEQLRQDLDTLTRERKAMPDRALRAEIDALSGELETLGEDSDAESIKQQIDKHEAALEKLPEDGLAARTLQNELDRLRADLEATPVGRLEAKIAALRDSLDETPEKQLEVLLSEVENARKAEALRRSYAGRVGVALEPVSSLAGFDWRTNIALVGGIAAKEVIISTLGTAYSLGEIGEDNDRPLADKLRDDPNWNFAAAVALILFVLLYSPCFVTLAVIKNESGSWKWLWFSLFFNLGLAYIVAVAAYQLLR